MLDLPLPYAIEMIAEQPCGFCFVDAGISPDDLMLFDRIQIQKKEQLDLFGDLSGLEEKICVFLISIGNNLPVVKTAAERINRLAQEVLFLSGQNSAWVSLRASTENDCTALRWHIDGHYFSSSIQPQYKFLATLAGPATLFFPLPAALSELRHTLSRHISNRLFMEQFCSLAASVQPPPGTAALLLAGTTAKAGFHTEPLSSGKRLFFSLVPCPTCELESIRIKVAAGAAEKSKLSPK